MLKCCEKECASKFCPSCGKKPKEFDLLRILLAELRRQEKKKRIFGFSHEEFKALGDKLEKTINGLK